jgi:hypothetical protein
MIRIMSCIIVGLITIAMGCKKVEETTSTGAAPKSASGDSTKVAEPQTSGMTEVPLSEVPKLTVSVDIADCLGKSKWFDPEKKLSASAGAVSVVPTREPKGDDDQPTPWVFDPGASKGGGLKETKSTHRWRLTRGGYTVKVTGFWVANPLKNSNFKIPMFDFSTSDDITYEVIGSWDAVSLLCKLRVVD